MSIQKRRVGHYIDQVALLLHGYCIEHNLPTSSIGRFCRTLRRDMLASDDCFSIIDLLVLLNNADSNRLICRAYQTIC